MRTTLIMCAVLCAFATSHVAKAADFYDGKAAYDRGDYALAKRIFTPLAEKGDPESEYYLGMLLNYGSGTRRDHPEARLWYESAARKGHVKSMVALGDLYFFGSDRIPRDYATAYTWYLVANTLRENSVTDKAQAAGQDLTASEQKESLERAQTCIASKFATCPYSLAPGSIANNPVTSTQSNVPQVATSVAVVPQVPSSSAPDDPSSKKKARIRLIQEGGVYKVPVRINDVIDLHFLVDSGASDVVVPADVVLVLMRAGTLTDKDFLGSQKYKLADGTEIKSQQFKLRSLKVGDRVLKNVNASVAGAAGSLLLGQSFLKNFETWSINNRSQELILE